MTWAAASSGPSQANQAALEAETDEDTYAAPDMIKYSPGMAKAWVYFHHPEVIDKSYNITSVSDDATTGDYTITIATDFSSVAYSVVCGGNTNRIFNKNGDEVPTAGALPVELRNASNAALLDAETNTGSALSVAMFGDQA
jgi:hypothetical protein